MSKLAYQERDVQYHDTIAAEYDDVVVDPRIPINRIVWNRVEPNIRPGQHMYDLGCGTGHATLRFGRLFANCTSVDHSRKMLDRAERKYKEANLTHVKVLQSEIETFLSEQPAESVNTAFCIGVLHHLKPPELQTLLVQVGRVLKPGGQFVTSEPRQIAPNSVPQEVENWNAHSIAPHLRYSQLVEETDEAPVDEGRLIGSLYGVGLSLEFISHHWELFPTVPNPSEEEQAHLYQLHSKYGHLGNAVTILCCKSV